MKVLAVLAVISLALIDGRNVLKGRSIQEVLYLFVIVVLVLAIVGMHIFYNQPFVLTKPSHVFRPITNLNFFLHSH